MISLSSINPYMLYLKIGAIVLVVIGLFWLGWHEMSIRADLKAKSAEAALQKATTEQYAKEFADYIQLNKEIADAIKTVKVQSNNYIQTIDSAPPPPAADGDTVVLVPAGVPVGPPLPGMSKLTNFSTGRAGPGTAGDPGDKTGK